jgi:hypothetical protein
LALLLQAGNGLPRLLNHLLGSGGSSPCA